MLASFEKKMQWSVRISSHRSAVLGEVELSKAVCAIDGCEGRAQSRGLLVPEDDPS